MNIKDIITSIKSGQLDTLKSALEASKSVYFINTALHTAYASSMSARVRSGLPIQVCDANEYDPKLHEIHNDSIRPNKAIKNEEGAIEKYVDVARLSLPEQKKIVMMAASFLGIPTLSATPKAGIETDMFGILGTVSEDNKLDYKFRDITRRTMSERECAELWYTQEAEPDYWEGTPLAGTKFKLRVKVISPGLGDTLLPIWDEYGDMIAFARYYEVLEQKPDMLAAKPTCHFDIYTAERFYFAAKTEGSTEWQFNQDERQPIQEEDGSVTYAIGIPNVIGKIPVVYYCQPTTEWSDVQELINRLEKKLSNHADTNDYFDSPIVVAAGKITGFAEKGEDGKLLQAENGATVTYLTWNNAPESMKMEIENLVKNIHMYTHTPDISFENVKGLGAISGIALKMFFMDAHLKAQDKEAIFGLGVQRRLNYLKAAIGVLSKKFRAAGRMIVRPKFTYFLPRDTAGEVTTIVAAYTAGIISLETAVKINPLVEDAVAELGKIKADQQAAQKVAHDQALELATTIHHSTNPINQPLPAN